MIDPKILKPDEEHYEKYHSVFDNKWRIQYDYRTVDGDLFSCIAMTVEKAREKRDLWITKKIAD